MESCAILPTNEMETHQVISGERERERETINLRLSIGYYQSDNSRRASLASPNAYSEKSVEPLYKPIDCQFHNADLFRCQKYGLADAVAFAVDCSCDTFRTAFDGPLLSLQRWFNTAYEPIDR